MTEKPFNNREIKLMFDNVEKKLDEHTKVHSDIIERLEKGFTRVTERQDIANGRTKTNELKLAYASGGLAVLGAIVVPILAWALYTLVNVDKSIDTAITDKLDDYQFEIVE